MVGVIFMIFLRINFSKNADFGAKNGWNAAGGIQDARFATTKNGCQYKNIRE